MVKDTEPLEETAGASSASVDELSFIINYLGQKWLLPILFFLSEHGESRYSAIQRHLPEISKKALSTVLQGMERYGFVIRVIKISHPPQVTYRLSSRAFDLLKMLEGLADWIRQNRMAMEKDADEFDERLSLEVRTPWQQ